MDDSTSVDAVRFANRESHLRRLEADGYTIIEDVLDADGLNAFRAGVAPYLGSHHGRNAFEGFTTERVYTLVGRGPVFEAIAADARLLDLLGAFLAPGFLLSASHAICINPGEAAQSLHFDDSFYPIPRPRRPIGMSVIGAIDAFTEENGATRVIPGSHLWGADCRERAAGARTVPVEMPAGAIALFQGTLVHGAGANRSRSPRLAYTNQYCAPWARTQENFFLGIPRERVRAMSPALQSLLGYSIMPPFMGQVTASHPLKTLEEGWTPAIERQAAVRSA
jgi:ectoine hydroxylase-related dioxygenase (phytanoyl-CoA dioxygenase family)